MPAPSRAATPACATATGAAPAWCNDIPEAHRVETPYCAGPAPSSCATQPQDPKCVNSGWQPVPNWCSDIPAVARGYTPQCVATGSPTYCSYIPVAYRSSTPECAQAGNQPPTWCENIPF